LAGKSGIEADELVQEAWVRAIEKLGSFRWEATLKTWLCSIVLNRWREVRLRRERDRTIVSLAVVEPPSMPPVDAPRLEAAIEALPAGYREILVLHDVEGYTHMEIASHFGIAEGTSKSQLHRARRALREMLDSGGDAHHGRGL
jgi:RNA polymerase sigma-70 factor (ECF subfamily)